jgi:VCBS repeat-containing protein
MINIPAIAADAYFGLLRQLLAAAEHDEPLPYVDTVGKTTIGRGFNIEGSGDQATIRNSAFRQVGVEPENAGLSAAQRTAEQSYFNQLTAAVDGANTAAVRTAMNAVMARRAADPLFAGIARIQNRTTFAMSANEIENTFRDIIQKIYEPRVTRKVGVNLPDSREKVALVSMAYLGTLDGKTGQVVRNALASPENGRAEAWFAVRYFALESYRGRTTAQRYETNKNGYAKRLFLESQLFGLYDAAGSASPGESQSIYKMLTQHRTEILAHEANFGAPPDGTSATRNMIAAANADANLNVIATVQNLQQILEPARDAFVAWVNTVLPTGVAALNTSDWNAAAIFYNGIRGDVSDGSVDPTLDARALDGKGNNMDKNLLVGGTGANQMYGGTGADTLIGRDSQDWLDGGEGADILVAGDGNDVLNGGAGNDTMYGGKGNDLYVWNTGDGADKIIEAREADGRILGRIKINGAAELDLMAVGAFVETAKDSHVYKNAATGLTLTHNSPWTLITSDGSTLQLGEGQDDFQDGDFGIHLVAATDTEFTAERVINGDLEPVDFDPSSPGIQTRKDDLDNVITSATPAPDRADMLFDSAGKDLISGGGGTDYIEAWRGGNDKLDGGAGKDFVLGRAGDDIVAGGADGDLLRGDSGKDRLYAGAEVTLEAALEQQNAAPSGQKGDFIDGDGDDDVLVGDTGNDALAGGQGGDVILGGAGNDDINGDLQTNGVVMGWSTTRAVIQSDGGTLYSTTYNGVDFDPPTAGGNDVIYGGGGDDWVSASYGNDYIDGGVGDDVVFGQSGHDDILGGAGADILNGDSAATPLGEHGDDYIDGGAGDDQLDGGGGNDEMFGSTGADELYGGINGDDYLDGEEGDDRVFGGSGADRVFGGDGADLVQGDSGTGDGDGNDYLDGEGGNDAVFGEGGDDLMFGGDGADQISGNEGNDAAHGGAENDLMLGDEGDDFLAGDAGDDQLQGGVGSDMLEGGEGNDVLFGEDGADVLMGEAGDDQISGGLGDDVLEGGDGSNMLFGDEGNDILNGGAGMTQFIGGLGDDVLAGGGGDDIFYYSAGDGVDRITDYGGIDWLVFTDLSSGQVTLGVGSLKLSLPDGGEIHLDDFDPENPLEGAIEYFQFSDVVMTRQQLIQSLGFDIGGTPGVDELTGTSLGDAIQAFASDDTVYAGAGDDTVDLGEGNDWTAAGDGNDAVAGQAGSDFLSGGTGNDVLDGGADDDQLFGDAGVDQLLGGLGNDVLAGGAGNDNLQGGAGNDVYQFGVGDGQDVVIDAAGNNLVQLTGGLLEAQVSLSRLGADLIVAIAGTSERLTVTDWFATNGAGWNLALGDGTVFDRAAVNERLVQNRAPVLAADGASVIEDSVVRVTGNALANDNDPEGRSLRIANPGTYGGAYGTLHVDQAGAFTYDLHSGSSAVQALAAGQVVNDSFTYTATDDDPAGAASATSSIVITVTGTNDGPVVSPDIQYVAEDSSLTASGNVLDDDSDVDGAPLRVEAGLLQGAYGNLTMASDGSYVYSLNNDSSAVQGLRGGQAVSDMFRYTVTDGIERVASTLEINIYGDNDVPVFTVALPDQTVAANSAYQWQIPTGTYSDIDQGDMLTVSARLADGSALPAWLGFDTSTGTFIGRVPSDAAGYLDIQVEVDDGANEEGGMPAHDVFRLNFTPRVGGGGGGGGNGGSNGNEGVGNGVDAPPPGHDDSFNDAIGSGPGNPGAQGGNGLGRDRPTSPQRKQKSVGVSIVGSHTDANSTGKVNNGDLNGHGVSRKEGAIEPSKGGGVRSSMADGAIGVNPLFDSVQSSNAPAADPSSIVPTGGDLAELNPGQPGAMVPGAARTANQYIARWAALDGKLAAHLANGDEGALAVDPQAAGESSAGLLGSIGPAPLGLAASRGGTSGGLAAFRGLDEGFRKIG